MGAGKAWVAPRLTWRAACGTVGRVFSRLRRAFGVLLLLCAGTAGALALLELFLRVVDPLGQRLRGDTLLLPTNRRFVITQSENPKLEREIVLSRNSLGFRGPDPPADFDRRLTLVAIGGSTTECRGLTDGKDWPGALARELSGSFDGVWVNNAGLDGHSSFGHLKLVEQRILALKPRVALFLMGINDVARDGPKFQDQALDERPDWLPHTHVALWAARRSAVAALALNAWRARRAEQRLAMLQPMLDLRALPQDRSGAGRVVARAHREEFAPAYRGRVLALLRLCRRGGIEPVLVTQPALYGPAVDDLSGVDLGLIEVDPLERTTGLVAWTTLEEYNDVLRELGRSEGVTVVDAARDLPKSSRLFYDFMHLTNEGAARLAGLVARGVCPLLATRFPGHAVRPCGAPGSVAAP